MQGRATKIEQIIFEYSIFYFQIYATWTLLILRPWLDEYFDRDFAGKGVLACVVYTCLYTCFRCLFFMELVTLLVI